MNDIESEERTALINYVKFLEERVEHSEEMNSFYFNENNALRERLDATYPVIGSQTFELHVKQTMHWANHYLEECVRLGGSRVVNHEFKEILERHEAKMQERRNASK